MSNIISFQINLIYTKTVILSKLKIPPLNTLVVLDNILIYKTSSYTIIASLIVKIVDGGLYIIFPFHFYFTFLFFFFQFSIFRTTRVRGYQSQPEGVVTRLITGEVEGTRTK